MQFSISSASIGEYYRNNMYDIIIKTENTGILSQFFIY